MRAFVRQIQAFGLLVRAAFEADRLRAGVALTLTAVDPAATVLGAMSLRNLVDALAAQDTTAATVAAGLIGLCAAASVTASWGSFTVNTVLREKVGELMDRRVMTLTMSIPTIEHHERPEYLDQIELLRAQRAQLSSSVQAAATSIGTALRLAGMVGLLATIAPVLALLPVFGVPSLWAAGRAERRRQQALGDTAERARLARHLFETGTNASSAKEVRVFGLRGTLVKRHSDLWNEIDQTQDRAARATAYLSVSAWIVFAVGFAGSIGLVAFGARNGPNSVGDLVVAVTLASRVNQQVSAVANMTTWFVGGLASIQRFMWLADYASLRSAPTDGETPTPNRLAIGIEFDNVSFRYPGTAKDVLRHLSFKIPAGATVAIVGDNGAGKSTLVKLLCRFYDPTEGVVRADGVDIRRFDPAAWRHELSAGFQDFAKFELTARETVGVGDLERILDCDAVRDALARAAAEGIIESLPAAMETQLGGSFGAGTSCPAGSGKSSR